MYIEYKRQKNMLIIHKASTIFLFLLPCWLISIYTYEISK